MIRLSISVDVGREHLRWAIAYQLRRGKGERPTKKGVLTFLREQIAMFGGDIDSLYGAFPLEEADPRAATAEQILSNLFPREYVE